MLADSGLSLGQAPPVSAPFLLFLIAPIFGVAAGIVLTIGGDPALANRWVPHALAAVHLSVLGFITPIMGGALLQVLPVLYGTKLKRPVLLSRLLAIGLLVGTTGLSSGFILGHRPLLIGSGFYLAATILHFATVLSLSLRHHASGRGTPSVLRLGIGALGVTAALGAVLVASRTHLSELQAHTSWVGIHLLWGFTGWIGLVLISVGSELMRMFYLSPALPRHMIHALGYLLFGSLTTSLLWSIAGGANAVPRWLSAVPVATAFAVLLFTARIIFQRQRKIRDTTLRFWYLGIASAVLAFVAWLVEASPTMIGIITIVGAGISITSGTLYKIIPFLCWIQLNRRKLATGKTGTRIPHMKSFIPERNAGTHLALHAFALILWTAHLTWEAFSSIPGSLVFTAACVTMLYNITRAYFIFHRQLTALA